ncbi:aspartate--tRNA ligase, putative [Plasmodium knowlesi strain H]|uniref:Aspartate--tRNA ligase, putative n=3 Tax=Plasmodium knowlesi TaxID=5850 RepID=A0A5K1V2V4_PLAKH|nr:aspartate--tRNA ligase, putative [Plasmodium knowlesi strain H]OTN67130.1 putative Asparagine--tRNA ligase [Plasmodium knowlesi]CAA9988693.1 aspartate--tRNA ligase, putative [Plasmodium knowlesi strain H]SBO21617.1 aspartate--tRNA ligase, putative [Plasmodium knowlesi strain H]SBO21984.1 aspartate--tRNA ligase, putative [Plasmodium knowlesi strain H]VVS78167.1 aspartate--tRNA ligase, putative [Plasmodium knowlesi strain H]|eukprot:XP_002259670.1 asparagine--tRNA ligase, putative [Plasmodium knowlesi strain H]
MKLARGVFLLLRMYMITYLHECILCYKHKRDYHIKLSQASSRRKEPVAYVRCSVGRSPIQFFSKNCFRSNRIQKKRIGQLTSLCGGDVPTPVVLPQLSDKTRRGISYGNKKKNISRYSRGNSRSSVLYNARPNGEEQKEHPSENYHTVDVPLLDQLGKGDLLDLALLGDFSFFYGTANSQNSYSTYDQIVYNIEHGAEEFVPCNLPPRGDTQLEGCGRRTIINKNYTRIRGRVEQKVKQSKRIFLRLRQEGGIYLICVYEKKGGNTQGEDHLYKYIKKIRNESVVDIIGHVKVHGDLIRCKVPFVESILNEKCIEIVVRSIHCISEAFDDVPVTVNEGRAFWAARAGVNIGRGDDDGGDELHWGDKSDGGDEPHWGDKSNGGDEPHWGDKSNGGARRPGKINTSEIILKMQHPSLHHRHPVNHIIFQMKNRIAQQLRQMLRRDGYTEVFTSKMIDLGRGGALGSASTGGEYTTDDADSASRTISDSMDRCGSFQLNGSEGGSGCYKIEGEEVILAQSPQFYKQMLINSDFERIFEMNYSYRNEKFNTSRHLNEFLSLDIEKVIYHNYYEIIIPMYNMLNRINKYIQETFEEELSLISSYFGCENFEPSENPDAPFVLSFCEARDIIDRYSTRFLKNTSDYSPFDIQEGERKKLHAPCNIPKGGVQILTNEEKEQLRSRLSFVAPSGDMLHNVYFNRKVESMYRVHQGSVHTGRKPSSGEENQQNENVYAFLNRFDRDDLYKRLLLFLNRLYDGSTTGNAPITIDNIASARPADVQVKCKYSMLNLLRKNPQEEEGDKVYVTESAQNNALKEKYLNSPDFTNEELQFLYYFLKKNFNVDLFIIDQYPFHLRPYYTTHNVYDMRFTNSFDFFYKGVEIISGSQRINHLPILLFKVLNSCGSVENGHRKLPYPLFIIEKNNFSVSDYLKKCEEVIDRDSTLCKYINSFRFGSKPHGGLALGFERYLLSALNLGNVKRAIFL